MVIIDLLDAPINMLICFLVECFFSSARYSKLRLTSNPENQFSQI